MIATILAMVFAVVGFSALPADAAAKHWSHTIPSTPAFRVAGEVADIRWQTGFRFILTRDGAVYSVDGQYHGGANGQWYFRGRTAATIHPCILLNSWGYYVAGYTIVATSGETYNYGRTCY